MRKTSGKFLISSAQDSKSISTSREKKSVSAGLTQLEGIDLWQFKLNLKNTNLASLRKPRKDTDAASPHITL
uniref:Uncharacterized protein n=1 Tax=Octopus bimaculoides TaxID=37653 RepID=A0A0L8HGM8_OCTBM